MKDYTDREHLLPKESEKFSKDVDYSRLLRQAAFELMGTFMFMCVIYFCKGDVTKFVFGFWVILTLFGRYSGAHVNPAITLGFYVYESDFVGGLSKLFLYWGAQFLGALLGALMSRNLFLEAVYVGVPTDQGVLQVIFSEFFFTGTFCFVILYVCSKVTSPSDKAPINCALIVSWFYVVVNAGSQLSGAAYNPAILTVLNTIAYEVQDPLAIQYLGYMITAELAGVAVFALIFKYVFEAYFEK